MSCISLTLQMSINNSLPLSDDIDPTSETFDVELSESWSLSKASPETKFEFAGGTPLASGGISGVSLLRRRGRAKFEPPKLESDLEFEPLPETGWSSFGVVRGREYFGLLGLPKVEFVLGNPGENPWPKVNELSGIAAVADSAVQTNSLRRET